MSFLVDTSALVRIIRGQVTTDWQDAVDRGMVSVCEPVICETLTIADKSRYADAEVELRGTYPLALIPDDAWSVIASVRGLLAMHSAHQGLSVADYLLVATAIKSKLVVLHEDADFETVARIVPQFRQQRISETSEPVGE